eukprot:954635-Pelagomonas_calceolata.AAC.1
MIGKKRNAGRTFGQQSSHLSVVTLRVFQYLIGSSQLLPEQRHIHLLEVKYCDDIRPKNQLEASKQQHRDRRGDLYRDLSRASAQVTLPSFLLGEGGVVHTPHTLEPLKDLGLDTHTAIKLALKLHAHSVQYAYKLASIRRAQRHQGVGAHTKICNKCDWHTVRDEEHIILDCPSWRWSQELLNLRAQFQHHDDLFSFVPSSSATRLRDFMNQADVLGLAKLVSACLKCCDWASARSVLLRFRWDWFDYRRLFASAKLPPQAGTAM